jgi:hypothetical protein
MLAAAITVFTAGLYCCRCSNEVVLPVGEYAIEKGTEAYVAGKELISRHRSRLRLQGSALMRWAFL